VKSRKPCSIALLPSLVGFRLNVASLNYELGAHGRVLIVGHRAKTPTGNLNTRAKERDQEAPDNEKAD
jgi:hypothetical protein